MMEAIHGAEDGAAGPTRREIQAAVDAFDPGHGGSRSWGRSSATGQPGRGAPVLRCAASSPWQALEDKVVIDEPVGRPSAIERAPRRGGDRSRWIAGPSRRRLSPPRSWGQGTVWAGDATQGFHGGRVLHLPGACAPKPTLRLRSPSSPRRCRHRPGHAVPARGSPARSTGSCSPIGWWCGRPAELVVLQRDDPDRPSAFVYGRAATFWDPPDPERDRALQAPRDPDVGAAPEAAPSATAERSPSTAC